jgi:hypothetical protein
MLNSVLMTKTLWSRVVWRISTGLYTTYIYVVAASVSGMLVNATGRNRDLHGLST